MNKIHSFRSPELFTKTGIKRASKGENVCFVHDLTKWFPAEFDTCDLLYSEISWAAGYDLFLKRAGADAGSFALYIDVVSGIIKSVTVPVILICGKRSLRKFPVHHSELVIKLNGYKETAYAWGVDISKICAQDNFDLLRCLSQKFNRVGDFSCGYGAAGRVFKESGKSFVMSDISEKCVTYIAETFL